MKEENSYEIPFQVQTLIDSMRNKKEQVHVRGNYRMRLELIKKAIEKSILDYDVEMGVTAPPKKFFARGQR